MMIDLFTVINVHMFNWAPVFSLPLNTNIFINCFIGILCCNVKRVRMTAEHRWNMDRYEDCLEQVYFNKLDVDMSGPQSMCISTKGQF